MNAVVAPYEHLPVEYPGAPAWVSALELAAPLARGQRYLVVGPAGSGRTTVLRALANGLSAGVDELEVIVVDGRAEELAEWKYEIDGITLHATTSDREVAEHADLAERCHAAAERAAAGRHVALVIDTLASLARAIDAAAGADAGPALECGLAAGSLAAVRRVFSLARAWEASGSLTIVAAVGDRTTSDVDTVVLEELMGTGNAEVVLIGRHAAGGLMPAIDLTASGSRHEERFLGEVQATRRAMLRGILLEHDGLGGYSLLLEEVSRAGSLDAAIDRAIGPA